MSNPLQNTKYVNLIPPVARLDNGSYTTTQVDTLGYDYATFVVNLGATDIAMTALKVQESDTDGSNFADVPGAVYGTSTNIAGSTSALPTATDDDDIFLIEVDLRGRKRYLDLVATAGNGTAGTFASGVCILSRASNAPVTAAERGCNQILRV
jgi:hypothetical protein